jgi:magnesium chelatase family protein
MQGKINTIAFDGMEVLDVDLQIQMTSGVPSFTIVGLPDKTVAESKERVRAAFEAIGISFPAKKNHD